MTRELEPVYTRQEIADAMRISIVTLEKMHERGDGPPRFKVSPGRWGYPAAQFSEWQRKKVKEAASG